MKIILALICALALFPSLAALTQPLTKTFQIDGPGFHCPGVYPITNGRTIPFYTALHHSGGFCNFANQRKLHIARRQSGKTVAFEVDTTDPERLLNFQVERRDHITVASYRAGGDFPGGESIGLRRH